MPFEEFVEQDEQSEESEFNGFDTSMPFENFTEEELENAGVKLLSKEEEELEEIPMFTFELKNAEIEAKKEQPRINIADILDPSRFVKPTDPNPELFKELYDYNEELTEDDKKQLAFKDYVEAPKLSGKLSGLAQSNIIPLDKIELGEKKVYIEDEKLKENEISKPSTVVLHKNELGEVETIEVICSCGRTTAISLIFKDANANNLIEIEPHNHFSVDNNIENHEQIIEPQ
jgi:hypothetical protein